LRRIIDLMMPGMSGYKLAREIRQLAPELPIIVASGMVGATEAGDEREVLNGLGVHHLLRKPFVEADLMAALAAEIEAPAVSSAGIKQGLISEGAVIIVLPRLGRLAQLVRAPASHAGGLRFESASVHHLCRAEIGRTWKFA